MVLILLSSLKLLPTGCSPLKEVSPVANCRSSPPPVLPYCPYDQGMYSISASAGFRTWFSYR